MRASISAVLSVLLLLGAAACDSKNADPRLPTSPSVIPGTSKPAQSIAVGGSTSLTQLGATSQLTVTATFTDGTTRDVTAESHCRTWPTLVPYEVARLLTNCAFTAVAYGKQEIDVVYPKPTWWPPPPESPLVHVTVRVVPDGAFVVHGQVTQAGYPLAGTSVTLTSGAGDRAVTTDSFGDYMFAPVTGDVTVRAELTGYVSRTQRLSMTQDEQLDLELQPATDAPDIAGIYRLTFTASPSCSLPAAARQRVYSAKIVEGRTISRPEDVIVTLAGGAFVVWGNQPGFVGTRDGSTVRFTIDTNWDGDYGLVELIDSTNELYYAGSASATIDNRIIDGSFNGKLTYQNRFTRAILGQCDAADHRIVFTR